MSYFSYSYLYVPSAILGTLGVALLLIGAKVNPDEIINNSDRPKWHKQFFFGAAVFVVAMQVQLSMAEIQVWSDSTSFWKRNFEEYRDFKGSGSIEMIQLNYVRALMEEEKYYDGLTVMRETVEKRADMNEVSHIALSTIYFDIGVKFKAGGETSYAIEAYEQSLQHNSNYVKALANLGNTFTEMGRTDTALTYLQKIVEIDPNDAQGWFGIGNAYYTDNKPTEALKAYKKCADVAPEQFHAMIGKAIARAMVLKERLENENDM
ncbi:hypothetical protein TL16_g04643 [Triparma laevis f. inornata]|uniref:Tetratricopeptide repeat protein n=1 Tax=Triparma laevis f. inornata TaxID=1714386 RepID=A0A9W7AC86_9STRA|nr:hypothetical protein TL16_g04643 [Triparma laevis f. inornata]